MAKINTRNAGDARSKLAGQIVWDVDPNKVLEGMKLGLRNRIVKKALNKGATVLRKAIKRIAPREKKVLVPSIGFKIPPRRGKPIMYAVVGAKTAYQKQVGIRKRGKNKGSPVIRKPAKYLHLVDQGTRVAKAQEFMTEAIHRSWPETQDVMCEIIAAEVKKHMA